MKKKYIKKVVSILAIMFLLIQYCGPMCELFSSVSYATTDPTLDRSKLKVGDYVNYTYDSASDYVIEAKNSGDTQNQTLQQKDYLEWRILNVNQDGSVDLVSSQTNMTLMGGAVGYNNAVFLLDDMCKHFYSNSSLGVEARAIKIEDIEKHFNDNGKQARASYISSDGVKYGETKIYTGDNVYYPLLYAQELSGIGRSEKYYTSPTEDKYTSTNSLAVKQTYYEFDDWSSYLDDSEILASICGADVLFSSRYTHCAYTDGREPAISRPAFGLLYNGTSDINIKGLSYFESEGPSQATYGHYTRAVVTLGSNIKITPCTGTNAYNNKHTIGDSISPTLTCSYSTTQLTNEDVVATITADEQIQEIEGWTLSEDKTKLTKTYSANDSEEVTVYDLAGNNSKVTISIANIDKVAPQLEIGYNTTQLTNDDVIATITSNEQVQEIEGWTLSEDKTKLTKTYSANDSEEVTVYDLAGNDSKVTISVNNIDKVEPIVSLSYSTKELTNKDVTVTITTNEKIQEVEGWTLSEDKTQLTKVYTINGKETVNVYDLAGNKTDVEIEVTNIDKTGPQVEVKYSTTKMTNQDVVVTITANEKIKELEGWKLLEDGKTLTKTYTQNSKEELSICDLSGNSKNVSVEISNIDKIAPEVKETYSITEITNKDVIVKIEANEEVQQVEGWTLSDDEKTLTKIYTLNGKEETEILDIAGNVTKVEIKVGNIDKIAPELKVNYSTTKMTDQDVTVMIEANEEIQEIEGWKLSEDKKSLTKVYKNNGQEEVNVYDLAGNSSSQKIEINNIVNNNQDNTIAPNVLPKAGEKYFKFMIIILIVIISTLLGIKSKRFRDIK